jgi:hypothetical protein
MSDVARARTDTAPWLIELARWAGAFLLVLLLAWGGPP